MSCNPLISLGINGRRGGIRTRDPLHPMQVRYQAALHADKLKLYPEKLRSHGEQCTNFQKLLMQGGVVRHGIAKVEGGDDRSHRLIDQFCLVTLH